MRWEEIGRDPQRISKFKRFESNFDWTGIGFPGSFRDIKKFESRNQISVNILAEENKQIYICRKGGNDERIANLMLITEGNRKHYVAIKSFSRLLSSKNNKHNGAQYFCMNCLQGYSNESSRDEHFRYCANNEAVRIEMSHRKPIVEYSDGQYQYKAPFMMYADFESILEPISGLVPNPKYPQLLELMFIPHLGGVLDPSLLMERLKTLLNHIEERIALVSFVNT